MAEGMYDDQKIDFSYQILTVKYGGGNIMLWRESFLGKASLLLKLMVL